MARKAAGRAPLGAGMPLGTYSILGCESCIPAGQQPLSRCAGPSAFATKQPAVSLRDRWFLAAMCLLVACCFSAAHYAVVHVREERHQERENLESWSTPAPARAGALCACCERVLGRERECCLARSCPLPLSGARVGRSAGCRRTSGPRQIVKPRGQRRKQAPESVGRARARETRRRHGRGARVSNARASAG